MNQRRLCRLLLNSKGRVDKWWKCKSIILGCLQHVRIVMNLVTSCETASPILLLTKHPGFAQLIIDGWIHAGSVCQTISQLCWKSLLQLVQVQALQDPSSTNFQAERDFHRICLVRSSYNAIRAFLTSSGVWITDPVEMSEHAVSHFRSVLGPVYLPPVIASSPEWFGNLLNHAVTPEQCTQMMMIPTPRGSLRQRRTLLVLM